MFPHHISKKSALTKNEEEIDEELKCCLCWELVRDPIELKCCKCLSCQGCLSLVKKKECPFCRSKLPAKSAWIVNKEVSKRACAIRGEVYVENLSVEQTHFVVLMTERGDESKLVESVRYVRRILSAPNNPPIQHMIDSGILTFIVSFLNRNGTYCFLFFSSFSPSLIPPAFIYRQSGSSV